MSLPPSQGGPPDRPASQPAWPPFGEFVTLIALMMSIVAFSIDSLLPAFGPIQRHFGIADPNDLQLVIYAYMTGFGVCQLLAGPFADMIGRRPVMMVGLAIYLAGTVLAILAPTYAWMIAARVIQGMGAAGTRVLVVALVRDRYEGREMARVMSLVMMLFITVPIVAPAIGSVILAVSGWRAIIGAMFALGLVILVWFLMRMPESLRPEYRKAVSFGSVGAGVTRILRSRLAFGYSTAMLLAVGVVMTYVGMAAQIFQTDVYRLGPVGFPLAFGAIGLLMGMASFVNSRLVMRLGMRNLSHSGLVAFIAVAAIMLGASLAYGGVPPLWLFLPLLAVSHFLASLMMPNFNAMAMERFGDIAGTASSFIGFYSTAGSALIAGLIARTFDSTLIPLCAGYLALGVGCLAVVLVAERGRLFRPHHAP